VRLRFPVLLKFRLFRRFPSDQVLIA
jgi:hypothetical protein